MAEEKRSYYKISEWLPYSTIIIVVIGYINHHIYFSKFGIPIHNFIDPSEILLLFVPFVFNYIQSIFSIIGIIILLFIITFYYIKFPLLFIKKKESKELSEEEKKLKDENFAKEINKMGLDLDIGHNFILIKNSIKQLLETPFGFRILKEFFKTLIEITYRLSLIAAITSGMYGGYLFLTHHPVKLRGVRMEAGFILAMYFLISISFELLIKHINKYVIDLKEGDKFHLYIFRIKTVFYICLFFYLCIKIQFENIVSGNPDFNISFCYNNKTIKTNDNLVYIGSTQKYIFLRNLKSNTNNVFKMDSVGSMQISKIEYTYIYLPKTARLSSTE